MPNTDAPTRIDTLKAEHDTELKAARDVATKAEADNRDFTDAERVEVREHVEKARALKARIATATEDADLLNAVKAFEAGLATKTAGPTAKAGGTLGERFTRDASIEDYLKRLRGNGGYIGEKTRVQSDAVHFDGIKDLLGFGRKAILGGSDDSGAGAFLSPEFLGVVDPFGVGQRPLTLRQVVTNGTTGTDEVTYARIIDFTSAAAPVAEASGTSGGAGSGDVKGTKPESALEYEQVSETVKTIAHWLPVTKRALSDAAQVRTLIDSFLRYGLEEELEDQIISGNGTGENFDGIMHVSGTQTQAWSTDIFETLRKAKTKAIVNGRARNLTVVHSPAISEKIDLAKDLNGQYFGGGPFNAGSPGTVWGMRRVETEAIDDNNAIVGDFGWSILWDREQAAVLMSDSHADFFIRNLVAVLAELRAAFGVIRPAAFVITDVTA